MCVCLCLSVCIQCICVCNVASTNLLSMISGFCPITVSAVLFWSNDKETRLFVQHDNEVDSS